VLDLPIEKVSWASAAVAVALGEIYPRLWQQADVACVTCLAAAAMNQFAGGAVICLRHWLVLDHPICNLLARR
jgi:hypothetical protein